MSQLELNIAGILTQSLAQMENILFQSLSRFDGIFNRKPIGYITAAGESITKRDKQVELLITAGWQPYGSAYTYTDETRVHCQPMVKYEGADK